MKYLPLTVLAGAWLIGAAAEVHAASAQPDTSPAAVPFEDQVAPVFRCIFEDRSRMVIVRAAPDVWLVFNPGTCGVQKIWRGAMKFRGKVWDFSQDNCAAGDNAVLLAQANSTLAAVEDVPTLTPGWTATGLEMPKSVGRGEGWRFTRPDSSLISPVFDASGWQRVFIAFDETGRTGAFTVEVSDNVGVNWHAQSFTSTTHATSDTDWQFNFKLLDKPAANLRVRWSLGTGGVDKRIRSVRIFGDRVPWSMVVDGQSTLLAPVWRGYERSAASPDAHSPVCTLLYDLRSAQGDVASVRHAIERSDGRGVTQQLNVSGLPSGSKLRLAMPMLGVDVRSEVMDGSGSRSEVASSSAVEVTADAAGEARLTLVTARREARP